MIKVVRSAEETSQKIVGVFLKRVKKSNLVNRKRKTQFAQEKMTYFKRNAIAVKKAKYLALQVIKDKIGKK